MEKPFTQITFDFGTETLATSQVMPTMAEQQEDQSLHAAPVAEEVPMPAESKTATVTEKKPVSQRGRRSLKDIGLHTDLAGVPEDEILFQKQYYSIGEVASMFRENQSLIRYWETEFDILQPRKNRKGDRYFRPVDIKNLVLIYDLLRRRKFTIEGAKDYLKQNKKAEEKFAMIQSLEKIKGFLLELKANI